MEIIMRRARRTDAAAINYIYNQAVEDGDSILEIDVKGQSYREEWLAAHDRRHPVYVGEAEGKVVCWVALSPYNAHYPYDGVAELSVYVERSFRHQGLGSLLLKFIEQQATQLGYCKIILSVYATNLNALHAYRRAGYRDVGVFRSHGYNKGKLYDIVCMERLLPVDMEALNRHYRHTYPFYEEYFRREEAIYEAQMLRNGMVRSQEDPTKWIPGGEHAGYVDDWNGQTVRVVKDAPALEEIMREQEEARREAEAEEAPAPEPPAPAPEAEAPEEPPAPAAAPAGEEGPREEETGPTSAQPEPEAKASGKKARRTGEGKKKGKNSPGQEDDGPLEGQILLDEVIGRQKG